jgi:tetratricopeptide (TPR) repeat protein
MSQSPFIYKNDVYQAFKALEKASYRDILYYYETNKYKIQHLDIDLYFEILTTYAIALFELGMYRRYVEVADEILEQSIIHNIFEVDQEDIFSSTLFRKAAAHYNLLEKDVAEQLVVQLLNIHPYNQDARSFYGRIMTSKKKYSGFSRALSVVFLLSSAICIAVELLVIRPFYSDLIQLVEIIRNSLFILGLSIYLFGEVFNRIAIFWKLKKEVKQIVERKKNLKESIRY